MFAIIQTGGKQYKVKAGDELEIELLEHADKAKSIKLDRVLLLAKDENVEVGKPFLKGAYADAELLGETKGDKTISFKYIRREKAATKIGHRQKYLKVKIKSLHAGA
ncbi:MAG TPA: 50S ribosomal protein L21 [Candidatus Eisenbacteria bacterium]|jgi:large subunit ribosomal protein L21|nr:50S ribosomal protein L21 [Candidatus Eisenbacteria bacterium]